MAREIRKSNQIKPGIPGTFVMNNPVDGYQEDRTVSSVISTDTGNTLSTGVDGLLNSNPNIVSGDTENDITVGSDGGAYFDMSFNVNGNDASTSPQTIKQLDNLNIVVGSPTLSETRAVNTDTIEVPQLKSSFYQYGGYTVLPNSTTIGSQLRIDGGVSNTITLTRDTTVLMDFNFDLDGANGTQWADDFVFWGADIFLNNAYFTSLQVVRVDQSPAFLPTFLRADLHGIAMSYSTILSAGMHQIDLRLYRSAAGGDTIGDTVTFEYYSRIVWY